MPSEPSTLRIIAYFALAIIVFAVPFAVLVLAVRRRDEDDDQWRLDNGHG